jgi:DNA repair exonuclease SbcCD ATPase subunit
MMKRSHLSRTSSIKRDLISAETRDSERTKRQAIAELEAENKEWDEKNHRREARPEDLERIRKLEEKIRERTAAIEKVQHELKHDQSELMNRKTAYNKGFNKQTASGNAHGIGKEGEERRTHRSARFRIEVAAGAGVDGLHQGIAPTNGGGKL